MSPRRIDLATRLISGICGLVSATIVVAVLLFLVIEATPALRSIGPLRFFTDEGWHPTAADGRFNLGPMLLGTLATTLGALLLAAPLGVLSAIFCREVAPPVLSRWYRRMISLMAGIPSVVYGLWGLATLAPIVRVIEPPGTSLLTGIVVLTIMILPTIALLAETAIGQVPTELLEAARALGLSRWGTLRHVTLPAARGGLIIAILLGVARAVGETMAVLMVCGNVVQMPGSLFDSVRTLTANIALELGYASTAHRSALFVTGLLLMVLVAVMVLLSEHLTRRETIRAP